MNTNDYGEFPIRWLLLILVLLSIVPAAAAVSIRPSSIRIDYVPYLEQNITFFVDGAQLLEPYTSDDLTQYVVLSPILEEGDTRFFHAMFSFPDVLPPGVYRNTIGIREIPTEEGMFSAHTAVQVPVMVHVPEHVLGSDDPPPSDSSFKWLRIGTIFIIIIVLLVSVNLLIFFKYRS